MVCPICGGKSEVGLFCSACYLKRNLKLKIPEVIELPHCDGCGSYLLAGKWTGGIEEEDAVRRAVERGMETNIKDLDRAGIMDMEMRKTGNAYDAEITVSLGDFERVVATKVKIKKEQCPECGRIAGGYYEAVLQLRGGVGKKTVNDIVNSIEGYRDRHSFVTEVKKVQGGFDIRVGSKKSAEKVVKRFRGKAEIKKSFEQVGMNRQTSKGTYRFYYLIRL